LGTTLLFSVPRAGRVDDLPRPAFSEPEAAEPEEAEREGAGRDGTLDVAGFVISYAKSNFQPFILG
jgi:hypothetical protein